MPYLLRATAILLAFACFVMPSLQFAQEEEPAEQKVADLAWLAGAWRYEKGADSFEEVWFAPVGEVMTGMGRHTRSGKHASHEFLRIAVIEGAVQYEAQPSGQKRTLFKLTSLQDQQAVFENPSHDFPTRVTYARNGDELTAKIEGKQGERVVAIEFKFQKAALGEKE